MRIAIVGLLLLFSWALPVCAADSSAAQQMIAVVDALDVENHWPAGVHVHWASGEPDGRAESGTGKHTHCSAFVAAAAQKLGIYILRPPEHPQLLLANAQAEWLAEAGREKGWRQLSDAQEAQAAANRGEFVVASYQNHRDDKPGHIAIVRPGNPSPQRLAQEGPDVTQAGLHNYRSVSLSQGFAGHPAAWGRKEVRFYAHAVTTN